MSRTIDRSHVDNVCKIGQGHSCCRYLTCSKYGFECEKFSSLKSLLDKRVGDKDMTARGDNCVGWAILEQELHHDHTIQQ